MFIIFFGIYGFDLIIFVIKALCNISFCDITDIAYLSSKVIVFINVDVIQFIEFRRAPQDRTVRLWDTRTPGSQCITALGAHTGAPLFLDPPFHMH
jgi:hypothetical protein